MKQGEILISSSFKTKLGEIQIVASQEGIFAIDLLESLDEPKFEKRRLANADELNNRHRLVKATKDDRQFHQWAELVVARCNGNITCDLPPLDWQNQGTPKQRLVWGQLLKIPAGQTISYKEMAQRVKNPNGSRAAAGACGANPLPIVIPCHRVIAADGSLHGFGWGLARKKMLLEWEGYAF